MSGNCSMLVTGVHAGTLGQQGRALRGWFANLDLWASIAGSSASMLRVA